MKKKGFTLVELIAVMAIIAIVGGLVASLFMYQNKMFGKVNKETRLQDEVRLTFTALESDIKFGVSRAYSTSASNDSSSLIAGTSIPYAATTIALPTINGSNSGKEIMRFKRSDGATEVEYFYVLYGSELVLLRADGTPPAISLVKQTILARSVEKIQIVGGVENTSVKLTLNNDGKSKVYDTSVSPRN